MTVQCPDPEGFAVGRPCQGEDGRTRYDGLATEVYCVAWFDHTCSFLWIKSMIFYYKPHLLRYSRTYPICWLRRQWGRHSLDERRTWRQFQGSIHGADIKVGLSFLRICSLARCRDTVWRSQISDPRPRYFESRVWSISRLCWFRTPLRPDFTKNVVFFYHPMVFNTSPVLCWLLQNQDI